MLENALHESLCHHLVFDVGRNVLIELEGTITRLVITHSLLSAATIDHLVIDVDDAVFLIFLIIIIDVVIIVIIIADLTNRIIVIELFFQVGPNVGTINVQHVSCCIGGDLVDAGLLLSAEV